MVMCKVRLNLKKERRKLGRSKNPSIKSIRDRTQDLKITLQNKFALLDSQYEDSVDTLNDNLTTAVTKSAAANGEAACWKQTRKRTQQTKKLILKRQKVKLSSVVDETELAELSKLINRIKTNDIHAYYLTVIEETSEKGESLKATRRKLAIGRDRMYALRDDQVTITDNMNKIIKIAERFCTRLYASDVAPGEATGPTGFACDVPPETKEEVENVLKGINRGNAAGDDGITIDLLKRVEI